MQFEEQHRQAVPTKMKKGFVVISQLQGALLEKGMHLYLFLFSFNMTLSLLAKKKMFFLFHHH